MKKIFHFDSPSDPYVADAAVLKSRRRLAASRRGGCC
jgi:hypothetical protein